MTISDGRWIVVETKPQEEFFACEDMERRGFQTFLPWVDRNFRSGPVGSKRSRFERRAFLPGYVFAFLGAGKSLYVVKKSMGVVGVLCNDGIPVVADRDVDRLKTYATPSGYIDMPKPSGVRRHNVKPGQVRPFIRGPFLGSLGTVHAVDKAGYADVYVDIFGRSTLISSVPVAGLGEQQIHPNGGAMSALQPTG